MKDFREEICKFVRKKSGTSSSLDLKLQAQAFLMMQLMTDYRRSVPRIVAAGTSRKPVLEQSSKEFMR
jgi:hypothetical protein